MWTSAAVFRKAAEHCSPDEGVRAYVCTSWQAEFSSCLCGLLMVLVGENFTLGSEPILILETRRASSLQVQLVRALADFRFHVGRRAVQRRSLPDQRN